MNHPDIVTPRLPLLPIPFDKTLAGPVTRARWRRTAAIYLALFTCGSVLAWGADPQLASFGLGLVMPGGGFLLHAGSGLASTALHLGLFTGTLLLFLVALFLWVATGNLVAPVAVWLGTAAGAAAMDHWSGAGFVAMGTLCRSGTLGAAALWSDARLWLPAGVLLLAAASALALRRRLRWLYRERARINAYLADGRRSVVSAVDRASGLPRVEPLAEADLPLWRFMLDRALQPVEQFDGFDRIDEFREAARRYQICNMSYMLSLHQYTRTPAFRGYQVQAQHKLALKMMDHRVWSYWRLENLWGNLRADPDPFARDNIMYYGWYGGMLGLQLLQGEDRFMPPGSIRLQHPKGQVYRSSFSDICQIIRRNMAASDFCLFPCEPRWIYPICNNFGALSLKCHDRVHGTQWWDEIRERYQRSLEDEFVTLNGRITAIRDYHTGLTVPALTATMADAVTALFLHPLLPELARRSWEIVRHDLIRLERGGVRLLTNGWDKIDFGNYRRSLLSTYALVAAAAREMGDDEVAELLLQKIDAEFESRVVGGVRHYTGGSTSTHAVIHAARVLRANGFHDLVARGLPAAWREGPLLQEAPYPQVLVAGAVSDGAALELRLAPGAQAGRCTLGLSQLRPGGRYRLVGAVQPGLVADGEGRATLQVDLCRPQDLRVLPAP